MVLSLDWGAIGVLGGAIYTTYQALTNNSIKNAILELKLAVQDRFAKVEKDVALSMERHLTLAGSVKDLEDKIVTTPEKTSRIGMQFWLHSKSKSKEAQHEQNEDWRAELADDEREGQGDPGHRREHVDGRISR